MFEGTRGAGADLVLVLLDARRGVTDSDRLMIEFLEQNQLRYQVQTVTPLCWLMCSS